MLELPSDHPGRSTARNRTAHVNVSADAGPRCGAEAGRAASALLAMVVAAAVATAMLNLYVDVQAKLRGEFRKYGANIVVVAKDGQALPSDALTTVKSVAAAVSQFPSRMPWPAPPMAVQLSSPAPISSRPRN